MKNPFASAALIPAMRGLIVVFGVTLGSWPVFSQSRIELVPESFWNTPRAIIDARGEKVGSVKEKKIFLYDPTMNASSFRTEASASDLGLDKPGVRTQKLRADRMTRFDGDYNYRSTFYPSVAPHKRMSVHDRINAHVTFASPPRFRVVIPNQKLGSTRFVAELQVPERSGTLIPLPSISDRSKIADLTVVPAIRATVLRDQRGSLYMRLPHNRYPDLHISYRVDVERDFLSPTSYATSRQELRPYLSKLPKDLKEEADLFARKIIKEGSSVKSSITALVQYFRGFREGTGFLPARNSVYKDLMVARLGVCRHRAFAFMATAIAAGIPTRLVHNETHAWVEVMHRPKHWSRIDLGGAIRPPTQEAMNPNPERSAANSLPRDPYSSAAPKTSAPTRPSNQETNSTELREAVETNQEAVEKMERRADESEAEHLGEKPQEISTSHLSMVAASRSPSRIVTRDDLAPGLYEVLLKPKQDYTTNYFLTLVEQKQAGGFSQAIQVPTRIPPGQYDIELRRF